jgi:ribonucleoside-diphosphate reductase alpha chain
MEKVDALKEMSEFVFTSKYARYNEKAKRRETWGEAVTRVETMHLKKYAFLPKEDKAEIVAAFDSVREKKTIPSMRSMQFGGVPIEAKNARIYNCSVRHVDSPRAFSEIFFLALCGCGVGIGLQKQFLDRLPDLVDSSDKTGTVITYVVEDTIEGWSDTVEALLNCYFKNTAYSGRKLVFDFSRIRKKGSKIKTGGGKAPGYKPLKNALGKVKKMLDDLIEENQVKRLRSIDVCDILCHCSDAVLSGGVRRSALSFIFDKNDDLMMNAKTGEWFKENPQRARGNNSVLLLRNDVTLDEFKSIVSKTREFGEPGFVFANDSRQLLNPCFEINFIPETEDEVCGVQFCNLTSINGAETDTKEKFIQYAKFAALIGTLQAGYLDFPYLGRASKKITEQESLLGVSITGMMDNPSVLLNKKNQIEAAHAAVATNEIWAKKLGINPAARVTCVKPEGTSSIILGAASGIHPHHSRKYLRRIQCNKLDNVYNFFKIYNPDLCEESVWSANKTDDVLTFPIEIPEEAMVKEELSALKHLDIIMDTQENWVNHGTSNSNKKNIIHSVSCTVLVNEDEWDKVVNYLYENRNQFTAVSLLPKTGDKIYKQAPMEAILNKEDEKTFNKLTKELSRVDYTKLEELHDETKPQDEIACGGGACEIK